DAVDVLVVQKLAVVSRDRQIGAHDFPGECMPAVVQISRAGTLDSRDRDGCSEQPGALHADPDHAEVNRVAGSGVSWGGLKRLGAQENGFRRNRSPSKGRAYLEKL